MSLICDPFFFVKFLGSWRKGRAVVENVDGLNLVGWGKVGITEGHGEGLVA